MKKKNIAIGLLISFVTIICNIFIYSDNSLSYNQQVIKSTETSQTNENKNSDQTSDFYNDEYEISSKEIEFQNKEEHNKYISDQKKNTNEIINSNDEYEISSKEIKFQNKKEHDKYINDQRKNQTQNNNIVIDEK